MPTRNVTTIEPLAKVTVSLRVARNKEAPPKDDMAVDFVFICGIGTEGLTGFEMDLLEKKRGDRLTLSVDTGRAVSYFEHLLTPMVQAVQRQPPFTLNLEVQSIVAATDLEVVQALSQKAENSGCGGGCGCGC